MRTTKVGSARRRPARAAAKRSALRRNASAFEALASLARAELVAVRANAATVRAGERGESLHDLRVAMRRLRSLIAQLEGVLRPKVQAHLIAELRWLAGRTGPARDLDTLMLELEASAARRGDRSAAEFLEPRRGRAQARLVAALESPRAQKLLARLAAVFAGKGDPRSAGPKAAKPFRRVLAKRLRSRWRKTVALADDAHARRPASELHELRIAGKKLRYLLEACRELVPKSALAPSLRRLKDLQTELGDVQDVEVQTALVGKLARKVGLDGAGRSSSKRARRSEALPAGVAPALARFHSRLERKGHSARARQSELAEALASAEASAEFEGLLRALERSRPARR